MGDEVRGAPEFGSIWTRMNIENHYDFLPHEGSILVPFRDFPENWASAPDVASLKFLDRDFIFPGEQFHILVQVTSEDAPVSESLTPFNVAASMAKNGAGKAEGTLSNVNNTGGNASSEKFDEKSDDADNASPKVSDAEGERGLGESTDIGQGSTINQSGGLGASPTTLLSLEGNTKRRQLLLESFRKSHYYVSIKGDEEPVFTNRSEGASKLSDTNGSNQEEQGARNRGCTPALMEEGRFDPISAGGAARCAVGCSLLSNGDIVVLLQVTMASNSVFDDAFIEVLQFERFEPPTLGPSNDIFGLQLSKKDSWDPTPGLLQWLLPLDRPASPPPSIVSSMHSSPPKPVLTPSNSNIFSFGHLRSASTGSLPVVPHLPVQPNVPIHLAPVYGSKEWDAALQERNTKSEVGSEGLLSFRGAVLEPQRFSANYGLEGPHIPGKRWRRKLSIFQPIKLESYFAHCNTQDLICVLVENVLPSVGSTAEVVIYVDSVSIVCQSAAPGGPPLPVPVTCVEVGDDQQLPGLPLRVGEQHSFILRPTSPAWKPSSADAMTRSRMGFGPGHKTQSVAESNFSRKTLIKDSSLSLSAEEQYAVIVSCHCSHTESRLHYRHSLQWRPRLPRDLLVSVSLENAQAADVSNEIQPVFKSQVVSVQATNLTSKDMNLTLHAPSSLANSPLSMVSFPAPLVDSPVTFKYNQQRLIDTNEDVPKDSTLEREDSPHTSELLDNSGPSSLPPVQSMESVIGISPMLFRERNLSAADIVADNSPARTHLWLQSTVPLGCVPAHSTTAVKCDILPLTDGIITLDTLHISTSEHDALYIPESPLQIYTTSSLASGVA